MAFAQEQPEFPLFESGEKGEKKEEGRERKPARIIEVPAHGPTLITGRECQHCSDLDSRCRYCGGKNYEGPPPPSVEQTHLRKK